MNRDILLIADEGSEPSSQAFSAIVPFMRPYAAKPDGTGSEIRFGESLLVLPPEKGPQGTQYTHHNWK